MGTRLIHHIKNRSTGPDGEAVVIIRAGIFMQYHHAKYAHNYVIKPLKYVVKYVDSLKYVTSSKSNI
jgi:hypothetical protein